MKGYKLYIPMKLYLQENNVSVQNYLDAGIVMFFRFFMFWVSFPAAYF